MQRTTNDDRGDDDDASAEPINPAVLISHVFAGDLLCVVPDAEERIELEFMTLKWR